MNVAAARASGRQVLIGRRPMSRVARARERGETDGFLQHPRRRRDPRDSWRDGLRNRGGRGDSSDRRRHVRPRAVDQVLMRAVHAHPTVSELIPTVLEGLAPLERKVEA